MDGIEIIELDELKENKKKFPWGTIISFIVLILIIIGYFVYDIFFNREKIDKLFSVKQSTITINYNETYDLRKIFNLQNIQINDVYLNMKKNGIIDIDDFIIISGDKSGEVIFTATYKKQSYDITVIVTDGIELFERMSFLKNKVDMNKNSSKNVLEYLSLSNIDYDKIVFTTTDSNIAEVINGNIVTKNNEGNCKITATYNDMISEIIINIGNKYLYFIDNVELNTDSSYEIIEYLDYYNIALSNIVYKISDQSLVNIENGKIITSSKEGKTKISASYGDLYTEIVIDVNKVQ